MSNQALKNKLAEIIESVILTPVGEDDLLIESGLIDSLTAVDIVLPCSESSAAKCRQPRSTSTWNR